MKYKIVKTTEKTGDHGGYESYTLKVRIFPGIWQTVSDGRFDEYGNYKTYKLSNISLERITDYINLLEERQAKKVIKKKKETIKVFDI